eukprot:668577-Hanusia_phi.AAC.1
MRGEGLARAMWVEATRCQQDDEGKRRRRRRGFDGQQVFATRFIVVDSIEERIMELQRKKQLVASSCSRPERSQPWQIVSGAIDGEDAAMLQV